MHTTLEPPVITDKILSRVAPSDVNVIARTLKLTNKHHASVESTSIKLRNIKKCIKALLHFLGRYRSWDHVIPALYHWNHMSKEQQVAEAETTKARRMSSSQAHVFIENRKFLMNNRPPPIPQDVDESHSLLPEQVLMRVFA